MPKNISHRELIRKFKKLGFDGPYSGGRHLFMIRINLKVRIPNPHNKDIPIFLINEILRQAGISKKEWDKI
ncbi:MAG: type II toxin-antitoxin system HicA family toxin [Candidatus Colwellbacteria bacterium]|nr:type II toxin-antitoxin system HicA family toxin [Candidatus Colwellbacteria bacterium]